MHQDQSGEPGVVVSDGVEAHQRERAFSHHIVWEP